MYRRQIPDASWMAELGKLLSHPAFPWFLLAAGALFFVWGIVRIVNNRNETLVEGNKTLREIQGNMAAQTTAMTLMTERLSSGAENMRALVGLIERIGQSQDRKLERINDEIRNLRERGAR